MFEAQACSCRMMIALVLFTAIKSGLVCAEGDQNMKYPPGLYLLINTTFSYKIVFGNLQDQWG